MSLSKPMHFVDAEQRRSKNRWNVIFCDVPTFFQLVSKKLLLTCSATMPSLSSVSRAYCLWRVALFSCNYVPSNRCREDRASGAFLGGHHKRNNSRRFCAKPKNSPLLPCHLSKIAEFVRVWARSQPAMSGTEARIDASQTLIVITAQRLVIFCSIGLS